MADIKWGTASAWADAMAAANFNALANNGGILTTGAAIDNSTNRHLWGRLSFVCLTSTWAVGAGGHLAFYLLPLAHNGTSYPNTTNGTAGTDYPGGQYWISNIAFKQATLAHIGVSKPFLIPATSFKFYCVNRTGAALPSSATNMTCQIETMPESVA